MQRNSKPIIRLDALTTNAHQLTVPPLSIEEKRQMLYSSLLRYSSETIPLRERVLDRVVLGGLIGSTKEQPYRIGKIQQNLRFGSGALTLRNESIHEALSRLVEQGKVQQVSLVKRNAYYLTSQAQQDVGSVIESTDNLFRRVLRRLLKDTSHFVQFEVGVTVCRRFMFECFARSGQVIARNVTGRLSHDILMRTADVDAAFMAACQGVDLSAEAVDSLHARCVSFLKSSDVDDEKLKFSLTQGYYFTQLLGVENGAFDPLSEHAFAGSVFYLDTNILIVALLYTDEQSALFDELIEIAQRIGIELRVTRATINEARRVAGDRLGQLKKIVSVVPQELMEHTDDQFIQAFIQAREQDTELTPEVFLEPFFKLGATLWSRWNISIDERVEEDIINGQDAERIGSIIHEAAVQTRGWGKTGGVLQHDVSQYLLIVEERKHHPKTWFLTRDRTLIEAATKLATFEPPFSFSLVGFLHSISPFVTTSHQEQTFGEVFSALLSEQILPAGQLFDAKELALMAEYHEDLMQTPTDQLVMAFDFVKSKALEGRPYKPNDIPLVTLELRKFLASSKEEQFEVLEAERARLAVEAQEERRRRQFVEGEHGRLASEALQERQRREIVEAENAQYKIEKQELSKQLAHMQASEVQKQSEIDEIKARLAVQEQQAKQQAQQSRFARCLAGAIVGFGILFFANDLVMLLSQSVPVLQGWNTLSLFCLNVTGVTLIAFPAFNWINHIDRGYETRSILVVLVVILTLASSSLFDDQTLADWSSLIEVGTLLGTLISIGFLMKSRN